MTDHSAAVTTLLAGALDRLGTRRPVYHSEADLQHELAWELHGTAEAVRLEVPYPALAIDQGTNRRRSIDLLVRSAGLRIGVELKYPKATAQLEHAGEVFRLRVGTTDTDRADAVADIARLEEAVSAGFIDAGALVLVTNRRDLWTAPTRTRPTNFDAFRVHEGVVLSGDRAWGPNTGAGSMEGRPRAIPLRGTYALAWRDFAIVEGQAKGQFRALIVPVGAAPDTTL